MDLATLAKDVAEYLVPALPYLTKASEKATEELGKRIGSGTADYAKSLWAKLRPKVEARGALQEVVQDLVAAPTDQVAQTALRYQLKKLLADEAELARELAGILQDAKHAGVTVILSGDRSVGVGGNISSSTIITGDRKE